MPKQLRADAELAGNVRMIASAKRRYVSDQILVWIERGVQSDLEPLRHVLSPPKKAAVTGSHRQSQEVA